MKKALPLSVLVLSMTLPTIPTIAHKSDLKHYHMYWSDPSNPTKKTLITIYDMRIDKGRKGKPRSNIRDDGRNELPIYRPHTPAKHESYISHRNHRHIKSGGKIYCVP